MTKPRQPAPPQNLNRDRRRAEALRANLRRRKEQAREPEVSAEGVEGVEALPANAPLPPQSSR